MAPNIFLKYVIMELNLFSKYIFIIILHWLAVTIQKIMIIFLKLINNQNRNRFHDRST